MVELNVKFGVITIKPCDVTVPLRAAASRLRHKVRPRARAPVRASERTEIPGSSVSQIAFAD